MVSTTFMGFPLLAILGAAMVFILLRWLRRPVHVMDIVRGAASWILAPLVASFTYRTVLGDPEAPGFLFVSGVIGGCVAAVGIGASLRLAGVPVSKGIVAGCGVIWGIGLGITLWVWFQILLIGAWYELEAVALWISFPLSGIAGFALLAIGLEKAGLRNRGP